eukprot:1539788-Pleurochrysis_carterae.AAC.1
MRSAREGSTKGTGCNRGESTEDTRQIRARLPRKPRTRNTRALDRTCLQPQDMLALSLIVGATLLRFSLQLLKPRH